MKQAFNCGGKIAVLEVPAPTCGGNEVLVQNAFSVISSGTELSSIMSSRKGIVGLALRAKNQPELVKKTIDMAKRDGLDKTLKIVRDQVQGKLTQLGYSSSGVVLEVGRNITDIHVGDKVACAGAGYANHAEIVAVPRNLVCRMPDGVDFEEAAFTTLGAIALQGVRRAQVELGDRVVVIGLGIVGQLVCQISQASGAFVIGIDPMEGRAELARNLGANVCQVSGDDVVQKYTDGTGADAVIICANTASNDPVQQAMQIARKKGRVVVVGAVGMELPWSPFYEKEIDFLISCSYGPGRYDPTYEEQGLDYPIGYVRWTENRNMQAFLGLLSQKQVDVKSLIVRDFPIEEAIEAYEALTKGEDRPVAITFKYSTIVPQAESPRKVPLRPLERIPEKISVAVIGAGSFARLHHLPNLKRIHFYNTRAIVTRTGSNAKRLAETFGAQYYSTDYKDVLTDENVDMVLIATRHNLHAPLVVEAARAGKNIFVEKPIALNYEQCKEVYDTITSTQVNLAIGFNRRFSPLAQKMKGLVDRRNGPMVINVRVNSAGMRTEHWINDPEEGGGAIVGEACHFFDFVNWLVDTEPSKIHAEMISSKNASVVDANNIVCTLSYGDGSVASITYCTIGNESFPKERIEIFLDGGVIVIDDFKELVVTGLHSRGKKLRRIDKGQLELLEEYGRFLRGESESGDLPAVVHGIRASICSLKALDSMRTGMVQEFKYPW